MYSTNCYNLPHGSWIRIVFKGVEDGKLITAEEVHTWLANRGIELPLQQISKKNNTYTATVCFTNNDIAKLVKWIMQDEPFLNRQGKELTCKFFAGGASEYFG